MPKNIYSIKENYKKVEEIREIKNKIPSYEEFLKNYNADEKVNDSYENEIESYSNVGVSKGLGPCSWNNPNCSCYESQGFIPLKIACPTFNCSDRINATSPANWFHSSGYNASQNTGCGTLLISGQGQVKCANCGASNHIRNWKFKCSNYSHYGDYSSSSCSVLREGADKVICGVWGDTTIKTDEVFLDLIRNLKRNPW